VQISIEQAVQAKEGYSIARQIVKHVMYQSFAT
jgi:hypothetical protein